RPELKVIITSATIQLDKFSSFFNHAPIIEVPGRQFPVESVFPVQRLLSDSEVEQPNIQNTETDHADIIEQIAQAVRAAVREGQGDILIFQSGEREIQETIEVLKELKLKNTTILPLYAR